MADPLLTAELFAQACQYGQGHPLPPDLNIVISEGGAKAVLTGPAGTGKHLLAQHVLQAVPADRRGEVKIETWRPGEDKPVRVFLGRG